MRLSVVTLALWSDPYQCYHITVLIPCVVGAHLVYPAVGIEPDNLHQE